MLHVHVHVHTVWQVIFGGAKFREESEKALRINFVILNFVIGPTQSSPGAERGAAQKKALASSISLDLLCHSLSRFCKEN